jgi:predicted RNase H-like nuclease
VAAIGVDMPIGLPRLGRRACDVAAKQRLGRAHPRVFFAPPRAVLDTGSHTQASALHRTLVDGAGMSVQTWHLLPRIAEVDGLAGDPRIVEVHPELSFQAMTGEVLPSKHSAAGRAARLRAARAACPDLAETEVPPGDDHLDAFAAAWSAARWAAGRAEVLPAGPTPYDELGRPMRVVV